MYFLKTTDRVKFVYFSEIYIDECDRSGDMKIMRFEFPKPELKFTTGLGSVVNKKNVSKIYIFVLKHVRWCHVWLHIKGG